MESLRLILSTVHITTMTCVVGGLLWFVILERKARSYGWIQRAAANANFQAGSNILGVTLALTIYTGIALYYLINGAFSWNVDTSWNLFLSLKSMAFLAFWVHWGWNEVVIMHPVRQHAPAAGAEPDLDYQRVHSKAWKSMTLLSMQGIILLLLGAISSLLRT